MKKIPKWRKNRFFFIFQFFSLIFHVFSLFFTVTFLVIYAEKPTKLKKAICSFIFLFFPNAQIFSCRSKIFQNGSLGSKNGPSDPLKFLVSLEISKIGSSGPFLLPHEPFWNFSHGKKKFSHCKKRKINEQSTILDAKVVFKDKYFYQNLKLFLPGQKSLPQNKSVWNSFNFFFIS